MKELSIEEKARRYDEAIETTRKWYEANDNEGYRGIFEDIFSELKESGDERIRKALIGGLKDCIYSEWHDGVSIKECIAWLEKQGEQKPVWSEKDSPYYDDICEILINLIHSKTADVNKDVVQKDLDWFISLKDRVQPQLKQEWSEEDEKKIESIESFLHCPASIPLDLYNTLTNFLKSLKERHTWKPSDEQMKALEHAINCYSGISPTNTEEVYTLEIMKEKLKKLMEK